MFYLIRIFQQKVKKTSGPFFKATFFQDKSVFLFDSETFNLKFIIYMLCVEKKTNTRYFKKTKKKNNKDKVKIKKKKVWSIFCWPFVKNKPPYIKKNLCYNELQ